MTPSMNHKNTNLLPVTIPKVAKFYVWNFFDRIVVYRERKKSHHSKT